MVTQRCLVGSLLFCALLSLSSSADSFKPQFHITANSWLNDPNGPFYFKGVYHVFYQWNPYGSTWGNMSWSHAVSRDLVTWETLPGILFPDQPYDAGGASIPLSKFGSQQMELSGTFKVSAAATVGFQILQSADGSAATFVGIEVSSDGSVTAIVDRKLSGSSGNTAPEFIPIPTSQSDTKNGIPIRVFIDHSVVEAFFGDGRARVSSRVYVPATHVGYSVMAKFSGGKSGIVSALGLVAHNLTSIWRS